MAVYVLGYSWRAKTETIKKRVEEILDLILERRGIQSKQDKELFFNPPHPSQLTLDQVGIDSNQAQKAIKRIKSAIQAEEMIVVYGDYDADGITATAILWETLNALGAKVFPFIPGRLNHGYGLTVSGVDEVVTKHNPSLIITVDNGIVAHPAASYCNEKGIDLIITDHQQVGDDLPEAMAIIHTTQLAGDQ